MEVTFCERLEEIGGAAVSGCTSLKALVMPSTVRLIGDNAFGDCTHLTRAKLCEGVEKIELCNFKLHISHEY